MAKTPVQITLRPYASSIPLASFAFGIGNALYGASLLHWIPTGESALMGMVLLVFVAPLELAPSLLAFLARDGGGATSFALFGASWVVQGLLLLQHAPQQSATAAVFQACVAMALLLLSIITFRGKPLFGCVLVVAFVRTGAAAVLALREVAWLGTLTGVLSLLLTALAFYCAFAFLEEDVTGDLSKLTFRTGDAKAAMEGSLDEQVESLEREAGVRKQL